MLRAQGFVDIHAKQFNWPVGRWAKGEKNKLLGRFVQEDLNDWLPSSALALFTRVLKWSREEVEVFLATVRQELKDKKRHFWANVYVLVSSIRLCFQIDHCQDHMVCEKAGGSIRHWVCRGFRDEG